MNDRMNEPMRQRPIFRDIAAYGKMELQHRKQVALGSKD
jgi:hypothetical protein